jgi:F-type H+-transporting ATPase subunit epsilon
MSFRVILTTPDKTWYDGQVESLVGPGLNGRFGVLERHASMIIAIDLGLLVLQDARGETVFVVDAGVAEVTGDQVMLSVDDVRPAQDPSDAEQKLEELRTARSRHAMGGMRP